MKTPCLALLGPLLLAARAVHPGPARSIYRLPPRTLAQ